MKGVKYQRLLDEIRGICSPQVILWLDFPKYQQFYLFIDADTKVCYGTITPAVISIMYDYCNLDDMDTSEILQWIREKLKGVLSHKANLIRK